MAFHDEILQQSVGCKSAECGKQSASGRSSTTNQSATQVKVLVADDEQVIANTLSTILRLSGFEALGVYSGEAAIGALGSFEPDILISDVMMQGITGIEAAIEIVARCPNCRVLLLSGQAATADMLHQAQSQGYDFELLTKPIHPEDLLRKLHMIKQGLSPAQLTASRASSPSVVFL